MLGAFTPVSDADLGDPGEDPEETAAAAADPLPDLTGLTKAQLLETAAELGVEGVGSRNTKAEIIAAIEAAAI